MTVIPFKRLEEKAPQPRVDVFNYCSMGETPQFLGTWTEAELRERQPVSCGFRSKGDNESYCAVSVRKKGIFGSFGLREFFYIGINRENIMPLRKLNLGLELILPSGSVSRIKPQHLRKLI